MLARTSVIILHTVRFKENSLIIHAYSALYGKMTLLSNSVSNKKSVARTALLQPLSILDIEIYFQPKKEISRIKESTIKYPLTDIPYNPLKSSVSLFLAELLFRVLKEPHTDIHLYNFLEDAILKYDQTKDGSANFHLSFMCKLTEYLGFYPHLETAENGKYFDLQNGVFCSSNTESETCLAADASKLLLSIFQTDFDKIADLQVNREQRRALLSHLLSYYKMHHCDIGKLKSIEVLQQLFD